MAAILVDIFKRIFLNESDKIPIQIPTDACSQESSSLDSKSVQWNLSITTT